MSNRKINLVKIFLKNSPAAKTKQFQKIFGKQSSQANSQMQKINDDYMSDFFDRIEVFGHSNTNISKRKTSSFSMDEFHKILPPNYNLRQSSKRSWQQWSQPQQLLESIRQVIRHSGDAIIPHQQLEQRLEIASSSIILETKNDLTYLFKLLLGRRSKIEWNSLQYEASLQLSRAIITAFKRSQPKSNCQQDWKELQAMEQLLTARQYKKLGLNEIAMNNLEKICKNQEASSKTRLEAVKFLCSSGEELGDPTKLELLFRDMQARKEKEYEQILLSSIRKIKALKNN